VLRGGVSERLTTASLQPSCRRRSSTSWPPSLLAHLPYMHYSD